MNIDILLYGFWNARIPLQTTCLLLWVTTYRVIWFILVCVLTAVHFGHFWIVKYNSVREWPGITNKDIALVTGGSNGLGAAIVKFLLQHDIKQVIIFDIEDPTDIHTKCQYVKCDLNNSEELKTKTDALIASLAANGERISILVSNAGIRVNGSVTEITEEAMKKSMQINFFSPVLLIQKVVKHYMENTNENTKKPLTIVSVSSVLGWISPARLSMYSASKAALTSVNESLMRELKDHGHIRVLYVTPGQLDTRMFSDVEPPKQFFAPLVDPDELAKEIVDKIDKGEQGNLCRPFYTNVVPVVAALPVPLQDMVRKVGQIDNSI